MDFLWCLEAEALVEAEDIDTFETDSLTLSRSTLNLSKSTLSKAFEDQDSVDGEYEVPLPDLEDEDPLPKRKAKPKTTPKKSNTTTSQQQQQQLSKSNNNDIPASLERKIMSPMAA